MNQRNRYQLNKQRKVQEEQLNADENLLKGKIKEWENQKARLPIEQKNRITAIQN